MADHDESVIDKVKRALGFGDRDAHDHAESHESHDGHDGHEHAHDARGASEASAASEPTERAAATGAAEAASWEGATGGMGASGAMGGAGAGGPVGTTGPETGDDATRGADAGAVRTEYEMERESSPTPGASVDTGPTSVHGEVDEERRPG